MNIKNIINKKIKFQWFILLTLVFCILFISFFYLFKKYNTEKNNNKIKNKEETVIHLNRYYHFTRLMNDPSIELNFTNFISNYDNSIETILIIKPYNKDLKKIFFFFHGMDGDSGDCIVVQDLVKQLDAIIIGLGGRGPSWLSDAFLSDAKQIIDEYSNNFNGFYLIGISMGGTQVLSLPGLLPDNLKKKVLGIISFIPGSDLIAISKYSSNDRVKETLNKSVNNEISKLKNRSAINLINNYREDLPFIIFYNENDTILLANSLKGFIKKLSKKHPVCIYIESGEHNFQYTNLDYKKIFNELGNKSLNEKLLPHFEN